MADTRPTPASFTRRIKLCLSGAFAPSKLEAEQALDAALERVGPPGGVPPPVRLFRAFWISLLSVVLSAGSGFCCGLVVRSLGCVPSLLISVLQVLGAALLLWGTLFVRGWDIQTLGGVTLTERVNRWLYVVLYCAGTAIVAFSLALRPCP